MRFISPHPSKFHKVWPVQYKVFLALCIVYLHRVSSFIFVVLAYTNSVNQILGLLERAEGLFGCSTGTLTLHLWKSEALSVISWPHVSWRPESADTYLGCYKTNDAIVVPLEFNGSGIVRLDSNFSSLKWWIFSAYSRPVFLTALLFLPGESALPQCILLVLWLSRYLHLLLQWKSSEEPSTHHPDQVREGTSGL